MAKGPSNPSRKKRNRKKGYRARKKTKSGRKVLERRRKKGRHQVSASDKRINRTPPKDRR